MSDNFITLSNRLLNRCPSIGIVLAGQFINDAWTTLQARREWSFRRRSGTFAPPTMYNVGAASTSTTNPFIINGIGTAWTTDMAGSQIRVGGLLYPFYTIQQVLSPTSILIDMPWAGPAVTAQSYYILKAFYEVPDDFGYFYALVSIKDGYKLWTNLTQADLALMDPQRTNYGQTYAAVYRDYNQLTQGTVGPAQHLYIGGSPSDPAPIPMTLNGFTFPAPLSYIIAITLGGPIGVAQFTWNRVGQTTANLLTTVDTPMDIEFGLQIQWPSQTLVAGNFYLIQCLPGVAQSVPRFELWPAPTFNAYLYPYIYMSRELKLSAAAPQLPPLIANRGEVLIEMGLQKCAEFPGADAEHQNIYHDLKQAAYHGNKVEAMLVDLERNDEELGVTTIDYEMYPYAPSPWMDGRWQQSHAPFLS